MRSWREMLTRERRDEVVFALVGLPLAVACSLFAFAIVYIGGLLAILVVGLPLVSAAMRVVRRLGTVHRRVFARMLGGEQIAEPPPLPRATGPLDWVRIGLTDPASWRTGVFLILRLPLALIEFLGGFFVWFYGAFLVLTPLVWLLSRSIEAWTVPVSLVVGAALLVAAPWTTRLTADLNRWEARRLLSPPPPSARQKRLEQARNEVAADATATLHRIERDLHDGTQARLVAIAVQLAMVDDALDTGDVAQGRQLVDKARAQVREATSELRQITRGINPVALDGGLEVALPTLAADAGMPTDLGVELAERPSPIIERIVYFCVAELITNAAKHSGADSVRVEVSSSNGDSLRLQVSDEGSGGAREGAGSGLRGLRDRVEAVDGRLDVSSPPGGPTVITAELPLRL